MNTTEMKTLLAQVEPTKAASAANMTEAVADVLATTAASVVTSVTSIGSGTISFIDRLKTGYKFQRALDTGVLVLEEPEVPAVATRAKKAKA